MEEQESYVKGKVLAIFFSNPSNYYKVMKILIEETDSLYNEEEIVVVGNFGQIQEDETYEFFGELKEHPRYGLQFSATRYIDVQPSTEEAVVTYLSSSKFKGIGPKTAEKVVDTLGVNCLDTILENPNVLKEVPGLNNKKRDTIKRVLDLERGIQKTILTLNQYGISSELAYRIYSFYEERALEVVQTNPYQLIYDIQSIGFHRADRIATEIGIQENAPERLYAGVIHTLNEKCMSEGDTYITSEELLRETISLLEDSKPFIIEPSLLADKMIEMVELQMIIQDEDRFYLPSLYASEWGMVNAIEKIKRMTVDSFEIEDLKEGLNKLEESNDIKYGDSQREAIIKAIQSPIFILTGGPGTGKTTVLNGLIQLYAQMHDLSLDIHAYKDDAFPILMAAPTGRAAKRMSETTGFPASTIHRLLGLTADSEEMDAEMTLEGSLLIIDEMSMVDTWLAYQLLKSIPSTMQVVLVGDKDQLPSVGPGQVLKDLIESEEIPQIELVDIYRQGDDSSIIPLAHHIKNNQLPHDLLEKKADRSFLQSSTGNIVHVIEQIISSAIKKGFTADDIQVLAPMYKGPAGINKLNEVVQGLMNPNDGTKKEVKYIDTVYRINDKVLHLVNDPERNVFNGDIGKITGIIPSKESEVNSDELVIDFDGNEVRYIRSEWNKITLSYCCSIHKAQGSEYKMVILPLTHAYYRMLRKDLLYTAITRASDYLILCGTIDAFEHCITRGTADRKTTLKERLTSYLDEFTVTEINTKKPEEALPERHEMSQQDFVLTPTLVQSLKIDPMIGMEGITPYND